mgnify:CR=1 FL=1
MRVVFYLVIFASVSYLIAIIFSLKVRPKKLRLRIILQDEKLDTQMKKAGLGINSATFNTIRYGVVLFYLLQHYSIALIKGSDFTMDPVLFSALVLVATSGQRFMPFGLFLKFLQGRRSKLQDGEWLSFLKLYEANLRGEGLTFSSFCMDVSGYFNFIKHQVLVLMELSLNKGLQHALDWLVNQYPNHPFMNYIRTIILSTDQVSHDIAVEFMNSQNESIARICNDYYRVKWSGILNWATLINILPIVLILFTVLALVILRLWVTRPLIIY